ncbi:uncharacterized protein B0T15DRAFT_225003 [Chaetomium strumarium]|uniref:Mediator of RNA polymerase II transcription subunit 18 n=1 Tax=Chaetomium strumarium TaxID=1170767 RepID=A0AAJ0GPW1_9PEZI|nr:hypothetical protein B0T15DRAFT_225003 [Chaetomium strumarium]
MPHEIFLSAIVADADVARARALLGGYTEMRERHAYTRVQHYQPQDLSVKGFPTIKQVLREPTPSNARWQELHQILVKQPSVLHLRFDITESVHNVMTSEASSSAVVPADTQCVLRWTEFPEPTNPRFPFLTQRKVVEIADQRAERILADNKFAVTSDLVEESYHWWLNDVEYVLIRTFVFALGPDGVPSQEIPNLASAEPVAGFWLLYVRTRAESPSPATLPEQIRKCQAQLEQVRGKLAGVFHFRAYDRRCHDTRIQEGPA